MRDFRAAILPRPLARLTTRNRGRNGDVTDHS
jgi:hypothetical protein